MTGGMNSFPASVSVGGYTTAKPGAFSLNGPSNTTDGNMTAFNMTATSVTVIEVASETVYSKYLFSGPNATVLNGGLYLEFEKGYTPSRTAVFTVFESTGPAFTGAFTSVTTNRADINATAVTANDKIEVRVQIPGCNTTLACYGHGTCSEQTGVCLCQEGYAGTDCETACYYSKVDAKFICGCGSSSSAGQKLPQGTCQVSGATCE